jgi:hypothetical protein
VEHTGSDSKCTQNFFINNFLRKQTNKELRGGGATRICEDKNKMGLERDVKVWAEVNRAKTWPLAKKVIEFSVFHIKR